MGDTLSPTVPQQPRPLHASATRPKQIQHNLLLLGCNLLGGHLLLSWRELGRHAAELAQERLCDVEADPADNGDKDNGQNEDTVVRACKLCHFCGGAGAVRQHQSCGAETNGGGEAALDGLLGGAAGHLVHAAQLGEEWLADVEPNPAQGWNEERCQDADAVVRGSKL